MLRFILLFSALTFVSTNAHGDPTLAQRLLEQKPDPQGKLWDELPDDIKKSLKESLKSEFDPTGEATALRLVDHLVAGTRLISKDARVPQMRAIGLTMQGAANSLTRVSVDRRVS